MAWSLLATMNQLGTFFQPGSTASGSPNAMSAAGCWLAARMAASPAGRLAAKTPWNLPGWMQNPVPARLACGWGSTGAAAPGCGPRAAIPPPAQGSGALVEAE